MIAKLAVAWLEAGGPEGAGLVGGLVLGTRVLSDDLVGLQELAITGLREADARALLEAALTGLGG